MTFTEAALEVLRREGKPLHYGKIAELAVADNLLDHVGKIPDEVMLDQLATQSRLPAGERKISVVQSGTFALSEWGLAEDPQGLVGLPELVPAVAVFEEPYRTRERHPVPSKEMTGRPAARGISSRHRDRTEGAERLEKVERPERPRRDRDRVAPRRSPELQSVIDVLTLSGQPMLPAEIISAALASNKSLPESWGSDPAQLLTVVQSENSRREAMGRKPFFIVSGETLALRTNVVEGEGDVGRVGTSQDVRRAAISALRRRLRECDPFSFEILIERLLEQMKFYDLRVLRRGRSFLIFSGRRRLGTYDVLHSIRVMRGALDVDRRDVREARQDLLRINGQVAMVFSAGDSMREARGEARQQGATPVLIYAGDALAEAVADAGIGVRPIVVPEIDSSFFESLEKEGALRATQRKEKRPQDSSEPMGVDEPLPQSGDGHSGVEERSGKKVAPEETEDEFLEESDDFIGAKDEKEEALTPVSDGTNGDRPTSGDATRKRRRRRRRGRGRGERRPDAPAGAPETSVNAATAGPSSALIGSEPNPEAPSNGSPRSTELPPPLPSQLA